MAGSAPCCFRLEATRGPHSGFVLHHCHVKSADSSPPAHALSIGRKKRCWLRLPQDLEVSSVHAEFCFIESGTSVAIRDVKSTNGTKLNGKPLLAQQDYPLSNGDLVAVGRTSLRFVQVVHGQPCGKETEDSAAGASSILTPSVPPSIAQPISIPEVIELDEHSADDKEASNATGAYETPVDQPDTEPAHDELVSKPSTIVISSNTAEESVELQSRVGVVGEFTPDEATCTVCKVVIGQLNLLGQQSHLNECLGGRIAAPSAVNDAEPKTRKRGNVGGAATRAMKPRKPKAGEGADACAAPKTKKPRKRKRTDAGESIELALALTGKTKMSKEEQTDVQLSVTRKKLVQLDEQMAKLTKRRVNLVKTLDRLERTKEKLRKSQVLPPAKVTQLLDLKVALNAIFPLNRQANPSDRSASKRLLENNSVVAKRYAPLRWRKSGITLDCDEEKQAELAAVAAISMWARASQQLFGLQRDTLLYRNSILWAFLGDDDDTNGSIMDLDNDDDLDGNADFEREGHAQEKSELQLSPPGHQSHSDQAEVPDVVKRVFPNWQRDLAFLHDQTADELERALDAMNEAQALAASDEVQSDRKEDSHIEFSKEHSTENSEVAIYSDREEQQLACAYMAQVMTQLVAEKRERAKVKGSVEEFHHPQRQQTVIDLVDSSGDEVGQPEQAVASDELGEKECIQELQKEV